MVYIYGIQGVSLLNLVLTVTAFPAYSKVINEGTDKLEKSIALSTTSSILRTASSKNN